MPTIPEAPHKGVLPEEHARPPGGGACSKRWLRFPLLFFCEGERDDPSIDESGLFARHNAGWDELRSQGYVDY
jgi:hypothetical protein